MEWELSVTPEQGGQLAEQASIEFFLFYVFVPFFGFVFVLVVVLAPEQGGQIAGKYESHYWEGWQKMQNKDYRTSKYLKVIIVIFLKQPWHTLIFTLCISCPLEGPDS